ncbi:hypothetical protein UA08_06481 [Talaromyces atroroseus]|uniref:Uncharacterized protein n=1 Tax=Talaromyces atroroseus TaxID=1441469 RepID=A0A225AXB2_TALAT|nr:hypothetical protein UA08_06481 [Talaromyces atroroseus]OKL58137.1 hypothetical protein UA08_06481 [Talaromyces atroroseus]
MLDARILPAVPIADFVNTILHNTNGSTTLVVCSTREKFLEQLAAGVTANLHAHGNTNEHAEEDGQSQLVGAGAETVETQKSALGLLSSTIATLANSRRVKLVFCSSLAQLRAYLSVFGLRSITTNNTVDTRDQDAVCGNAMIAILDLIAMHCLSTEFSAQGLSRTLALAVETAARTQSAIMLCECSDMVNVGNPDHGQRLWDLHVPLLNGGTIRVGNDHAPSARSGRHVSIRRVAQRWFKFEERS